VQEILVEPPTDFLEDVVDVIAKAPVPAPDERPDPTIDASMGRSLSLEVSPDDLLVTTVRHLPGLYIVARTPRMTDPVKSLVPPHAAKVSAIALLVLFSDRGLNDSPVAAPSSPSFDLDGLSPEDRALLQMVSEGRSAEARRLSEKNLASLPETCAAYALAVEAARQGGWLPELSRDLQGNQESSEDPRRLYGLAAALAELGEEERALNLFAAAIARGSPCAGSYRAFLYLSSKRGRLGEAASVLGGVVRENPGNPHALVALGLAQEALGESLLAKASYERALLEAPPSPGAHLQLASLLARMGRFDASLHVSELGRRRAAPTFDPATSIRLLRLESRALLMLGRTKDSTERFERALREAVESKMNLWLAETLLDGSDLAGASGDGNRALALLERAASVRDDRWAPSQRASFHLRLGSAFLGTADRQRAEAHLTRGLEYALQASEPHLVTDIRLTLVHLWISTGDTTRALEEGARVLAEAIRLRDPERQARALAAMGAVYDRLGRYRDALESYRQALRFEERTLDRHRQALALGNLSLVYLRMGLPGPAVVHASQALSLARVLPDVRLQVSLKQAYAASLAGAGDFRQSERAYAEILALVSRLSSPELLGLVLAGRGRVLLALGRLDEAERHIRDALDLALSNGDSLLHLQAKSGLALVDWQRGDLDAAVEHLEESRRLVEDSRGILSNESDRMSYGETISQIYSNLATILTEVDRRKPDPAVRHRAFLAVEQSRARSLLDLLGGAGRSSRATGVAPGPVEPLGASALKLGPKELLLSFELGETRSTLWILSPRGLSWRELPSRSTLESKVESFLDTVRLPPRSPENPFDRHRERARELYSILLAPAAAELRGANRLILSPDSILYRLPFETLLSRGDDGRERYLVETHTVSYTPSVAVLVNLRRRRPDRVSAAPSFLGIAQPGGVGGLEGAIPHAVEEVESVGALFAPERRRLLVGAAADERSVKTAPLTEFRMLHIAAHGLADERFPLRSALFVGADRTTGEDGVLRMGEVLELELDSDLVVLSGCETGRGRLLRSEGALGFSWAFLSAGASTVAVSLWNVNDRATSELMVTFYKQVMGEPEGREPKTLAEAMALAKRTMLNSERPAYRHPYYWAPFVLIGTAEGASR
jgi:CHAT domain-containing protein/tetratricopeptide (TPR) repeat protein